MQSRKDALEEKFSNFKRYLREHSPTATLVKLEEELLQRHTEDIWIYVQSQTSLDPKEGALRFIERYSIPQAMHSTIERYFACFEYLLMEETVD